MRRWAVVSQAGRSEVADPGQRVSTLVLRWFWTKAGADRWRERQLPGEAGSWYATLARRDLPRGAIDMSPLVRDRSRVRTR